MTDTQEELQVEDLASQPQPTLAWIGSIPLFIGNVEDTVEKAKAQGFKVFFVFGSAEKKVGTTTTTTVVSPQLFKVTDNLVGYAVTPIDVIDLGLEKIKTDAWFNLPPIPWELISDIDDFFREVYRKHGTEAIVMLTFDPKYLDDTAREEGSAPSDGWGVLVPKQKNTASACDYEPSSIVDDKPDDVYIVGTCHSHPGMGAFCSGTDKADQAHFDGLHITFGWSRGSDLTDFHIELQNGGAFNMKPENVFLDMPEEIENERIASWMERVEKKSYSSPNYSINSNYPTSGYRGTGSGGGSTGTSSQSKSGGQPQLSNEAKKRAEKYINLPKECPLPELTTVICNTWQKYDELNFCPCCGYELDESNFINVRCSECMVYLMWDGVTMDKLIEMRKASGLIALEIDPRSKPDRAIFLWEIKVTGDAEIIESVTQIWDGNSGKGKAGSSTPSAAVPGWNSCDNCGKLNPQEDNYCFTCTAPLKLFPSQAVMGTDPETLFDSDDDEEELGPLHNLCCDELDKFCMCHSPLTYDQADDHVYPLVQSAQIPVYRDENCDACMLQFSASCPGYRQWLVDFVETELWVHEDMSPANAPDPLTVCASWQGAE